MSIASLSKPQVQEYMQFMKGGSTARMSQMVVKYTSEQILRDTLRRMRIFACENQRQREQRDIVDTFYNMKILKKAIEMIK